MKWLTLLFALFILLIIVLADTDRLGVLKLINRLPFGDKLGHFVLYGILALLVNVTLLRSFPWRRPVWVVAMSSLALGLLIGLEEFSQQYFSSRTSSLSDLGASYLGVMFFSRLALRSVRHS